MNEQEIFLQILDLDSPAQRSAFLEESCGDDAALRQRVESLLRSHDDAGSFLEAPAGEPEPTLIDTSMDDDMFGRTVDSEHHTQIEDDWSTTDLSFLEPAENPENLGRLGSYEVAGVIGRGGMGIVLRAIDPHLNRVVAIKTLAPDYAGNPTARKRFAREAQAAAAVSHPHVVTIHAVEPAGKVPFLVMELVQGQSLREKLDKTGALEVREILRIGSQIAQGLAAAHDQGLIHRDIKPGNVLLENGVERVKLTDFGLARATDDVAITRTGDIAGTPQFMSPEQAEGKVCDQRSDLFSLGSVLYAMCTGRPPFRGDTAIAVLRKVCDGQPRPIREVNTDIPGWLVDIVEHLLAKDPDHRIQTAEEVARILNEHLAELQNPSSGSKPKFERRLPREKRGLSKLAVTAMCLLVLLGGLAMTEATGVTQIVPTVIRIVRGDGTLIVEVDDPSVSVTIDGEDVVITGAGVNEIRVKPGEHKVVATKNGKPVQQEVITIERGGQRVVRIATEKAIRPGDEILLSFSERNGMLIIERDGKPIRNAEEMNLFTAMLSRRPGSVVRLQLGDGYDPESTIHSVTISALQKAVVDSGAKFLLPPEYSDRTNPGAADIALREQRQNQLRQIGFAFHVHHEAHRQFPPATEVTRNGKKIAAFDDQGRPFLSWRVHLLPFVEQQALYEQFKLDEPWDSPHNKPLLAKMPAVYKTGDDPAQTTFQMVVGKGTAYERRVGLGMSDITDGLTNTALVVDAGKGTAVPWTKPEDLPLNLEEPIRAFGKSDFGNEFLAVLADGSSRSIAYDTAPEQLRNLFLRADGNVVDLTRKRTTPLPVVANTEGITLLRKLAGHTGPVKSVAYSADGKWIAAGSGYGEGDQTARIWNAVTGGLVHTIKCSAQVSSVAFSPDSQYLLVGVRNGESLLHRVETAGMLRAFQGLLGQCEGVGFSRDGKQVAAWGGNQVRVNETATGKLLKLEKAVNAYTMDVAFANDNRLVAVDRNGQVTVWNLQSGDVIRQFPEKVKTVQGGGALALLNDDKQVMTVCGLNAAAIYNLDTGKLQQSPFLDSTSFQDIAVTPDGRHAICAGNGAAILLEIATARVLEKFQTREGVIWSVAISPDGKRCLTAGGSKFVSGEGFVPTGDYDLREWQLPRSVWPRQAADAQHEDVSLLRKFQGHTGTIKQLAFSPDGTRAVSASGWPYGDGNIILWDTTTGKVLRILGQFSDSAKAGFFSADGQRIAGSGFGRDIKIWDANDGRELASYRKGFVNAEHLAFSPDGRYLLFAGQKPHEQNGDSKGRAEAQLWDTEADRLVWKFAAKGGFITCAFLPEREKVLLGGFNTGNAVHVLDKMTGRELQTWGYGDELVSHTDELAVSPDGRFVVAVTMSGHVCVWNVEQGGTPVNVRQLSSDDVPFGAIHRLKSRPTQDSLHTVAYSPDGKWLATGGHQSQIHLLEFPGLKTITTVPHPAGSVWDVAVAPDGRSLLTGGGSTFDGQHKRNGDYSLYHWQLPQSVWPAEAKAKAFSIGEITLLRKLEGPTGGSNSHHALAVSRDGSVLVSGGDAARVWETATGKLLRKLPGTQSIIAVAVSPDGKLAAGMDQEGNARLWSLATGRLLHLLPNGPKSCPGIVFTTDSRTLVTASSTGKVVAWNVATGKAAVEQDFGKYIWDMEALPDNTTILVAEGPRLNYWNLETSQIETKLTLKGMACISLRLSRDGKTLLIGSKAYGADEGRGNPADNTVQVWDTTTWREVQRFTGHTYSVTSVEFLPNERCIVSGGSDGRIILWDRETGKEIARQENLGHLANSVKPVLDGTQVASYGQWYDNKAVANPMQDDFAIRIWRLPEIVQETASPERKNADVQSLVTSKAVIAKAAGIPTEEWLKLATSGQSDPTKFITGSPLSLVLLLLNPAREAKTNAKVLEDFQYLTPVIPRMKETSEAMSHSAQAGYVSVIQSTYITELKQLKTANDKARVDGVVEFECPRMYKGKVEFTAEGDKENWRVVEFRLPNYGITIRLDEQGVWRKTVENKQPADTETVPATANTPSQ